MTNPNQWEEEWKTKSAELLDEYFPKDNYDHPERQSTTHRSEALAFRGLLFILTKSVAEKIRAEAYKQGCLDTKLYWEDERESGRQEAIREIEKAKIEGWGTDIPIKGLGVKQNYWVRNKTNEIIDIILSHLKEQETK